jgi:hypothetical protein
LRHLQHLIGQRGTHQHNLDRGGGGCRQ